MMLVQLSRNETYDVNDSRQLDLLVEKLKQSYPFVHLGLLCTDFNDEELKNFLNNISKHLSQIPCKFTLLKQEDDQLVPIYEFERLKFQQQMRSKYKQVKSQIDDSKEVIPLQISEHKRNRVLGKKVTPSQQQLRIMGHQLNPELEEMASTGSAGSTEENRLPLGASSILPYYTSSDTENSLITAENIESFRQYLVRDRDVDLADAWQKIVAVQSVDYIDRAVMLLFLLPENYAKLSSGFLPSNLPVVVNQQGEIIQHVQVQRHGEKNVWSLQDGPRQDINEYTLVLDRDYSLPNRQSFIDAKLWPDTGYYEADLNCIFKTDQATKENIQQILFKWCGEADLGDVSTLLSELPREIETKEFLRGCIDILVTAGPQGLIVFLDKLVKMDASLIEVALKHQENFAYFASQDGIDKLVQLSSLSPESKEWWKWLVAAHARTGDRVIFSELFVLFKRFEGDLAADLGNKLPKLPFNDEDEITCNMQVVLQVIFEIVSAEPTQLHYLGALKNGILQARAAIKSNALRIVTQEMQLNRLFHDLNTIQETHEFARKMLIPQDFLGDEELENQYALLQSLFLLYCARKQDDFENFKYDNYEKIRRDVNELSEALQPVEQGPALYFNELPHGVKYGFVAKKGRGDKIEEVRFCDISKNPMVSIVCSNISGIINFYKTANGSINEGFRPNWQEIGVICGPAFTRYFNSNGARFTELDCRSKSSLLYIAAIAASGRRVVSQQGFSSRDLTKFLQALKEFAGHFGLGTPDLIRRMHEKGLDENNCPTLAELAEIFDILHKSFPRERISYETLDSILVIIKEHGNHAVEIVSNICAIAEKRNEPDREPAQAAVDGGFEEQKQQEPQSRGQDQNAQIPETTRVSFIASYVSYLQQITDVQAPEKAIEVARAFALLIDYDSADEAAKIDLINAIQRTSIDRIQALVTKLASLNVKDSASTLKISYFTENLRRIQNVNLEQVVPTTLDYLHQNLSLELKYHVSKVTKSQISMRQAIKALIEVYELHSSKAIGAAQWVFNGDKSVVEGFKSVGNYVQQLKANINLHVDEDELLDILNKVANRLKYIKNDLFENPDTKGRLETLKWTVNRMFTLGDPNVGEMVEAFFECFSLSVFMDRAVETCIDEEINSLIDKVFARQSLKAEDKPLHNLLWQFMKAGAKPTGFGLVEIDFDPQDLANQARLRRESLKLADGIVLYNDTLYHVQNDNSLTVKRIHTANLQQKQAYDSLILRIKEDNRYRAVGFDGCILLKIRHLSDGSSQDVKLLLLKHVREISPSRNALILYDNCLYEFDHELMRVSQHDKTSELEDLFKGNFTSKVVDAIPGDTDVRFEHGCIRELGIDQVISVSDTVNLYNVKLDIFSGVLNDLENIKGTEPTLFRLYVDIFKKLANTVTVIDDLIYVIHYLNIIFADSPALKVKVLTNIFELAKSHADGDQKISFNALRISMEELALANYRNGTLQNILHNMLPFCMRGSIFPLNVFKDFEDEPEDFIKDILQLAVESTAKTAKLEDAEEHDDEESLGGIIRDVPAEEPEQIDVFALIKDLNKEFDPAGIKYIQSALLKALVHDNSKKQDFKRICDKIAELNRDPNLIKYYSIFEALKTWQKVKNSERSSDDAEVVFTLEDIENLLDGLSSKRDDFDRIFKVIFETRPYPNDLGEWRKFLALIKDDSANAADKLQQYLVDFDRHPYGETVRQKAEQHYKTTRVLDIINGIQHMPDDIPLTYAEKEQLVKDFSYVNALRSGAYEFHPVDENDVLIQLLDVSDAPNTKPMFLHDCAAKDKDNVLSTDELKQLAARLKIALQNAEAAKPQTEKLFHKDNRKLALQYISVMFELYYRTTGIIPNPAQVLTVIEGLDKPGKQLFEIETAEGKSVTTALFAGLLCAKKSTVLVPTSSDILVDQDLFKKKNDLFFKALGFNAHKVDANTTRDEIELGCIYYGTSRNIDSIIAECRIMDVSLTHTKDGKQFGLAIVKDEEDNDLDDPAQRNLAIAQPVADKDLSPTWIISAINKFIREERYLQIEAIDRVEPDDKDADERSLKDYLLGIANKQAHKLVAIRQVEQFEPLLREFLDIADDVCGFEEEVDFQVLPTAEEGYSQATPINGASGFPERGNTHSGYVQAFLHDRLNLEGKHTKFAVEMAPMLIDSQTNKSIATDFDYFVGLSATVGSRNEVLEMAMPATRIPPFREKVRDELPPQAVKNEADKHLAILDAIRFNGYATDFCPRFILDLVVRIVDLYKKTYELLCKLFNKSTPEASLQPILVFVNNPKEAQELADKISGKINKAYKKVQVITGKEDEEELAVKVKRAGEKNVITIGEPVLGRGMDYSSKHPDGIFVVKAFNSTLRGKVQVLGRCGRDEKPGKFLDILSDGEFSYDSLLSRVFGLTRYQKEQQVKSREEKINAQSAVQRYFTQEVDAYIQVILRQFDEISHILIANGIEQDSIFIMRAELLQLMQKQWEIHLQLIDRDNEHGANKYVGENKSALVSELANFKVALCNNWKDYWLDAKIRPMVEDIKSEIDAIESVHRLDLLIAEDIRESFKYRVLSQQAAEIKIQRIAAIPQELVNKRLEKFIDGRRVVMEYDARAGLDFNDLKVEYVRSHLGGLLYKYSWLGVTAVAAKNGELDVQQSFKNLVDAILDKRNTDTDIMRLYPLAKECLDIADMGVLSEVFCQENVESLRQKYSKETAYKEIVTKFAARHKNINSCLFKLGIKTKTLDKVFADLHDACTVNNPAVPKVDRIYTALHKCLCILENDNSTFPFASFLFGTYDLKSLLKQTIVDIEGLYTLESSLSALEHKAEVGTCSGYFEVFLSDKEWEKIKKRLPKEADTLWNELKNVFDGIVKDKDVGFAEIEELIAICRHYRHRMIDLDNAKGLTHMVNAFSFSYSGVRFEDSIDMLLAKLRQIKAKVAQDNPKACFTQQQKYLAKKSKSLKTRLSMKDTDDLQIRLRWNGEKVSYEVMVSHTGDLNEGIDGFTSLNILDGYYNERRDLLERKAAKEHEMELHREQMNAHEGTQRDAEKNYRRSSWVARGANSLLSSVTGAQSITSQKENADLTVQKDVEQVNADGQEIADLDRKIAELEKRMCKFGANIKASDSADVAMDRKTAVRTFDTLEDLLTFENKFRAHDALSGQTFTAVIS